ncbi:MAG: RHS repeat-associated core domain-containing protein [Deltaproteobacteria bacterium]
MQYCDGTEERIDYRTWSNVTRDRSDTVVGSDWERTAAAGGAEQQRARTLALVHADTPMTAHVDALGRTFRIDEDNGTAAAPDLHTTTSTLDLEGRPVLVTDGRGNTSATTTYDLLGRSLAASTCDGGSWWTLPATDGQPARTWDSRGHAWRMTYDRLRRPVSRHLRVGAGAEVVRSHVVYGSDLPTATARAQRCVGHAYAVYDAAGARRVLRRDFDGNTLEVARRLRAAPDAAASVAVWSTWAQGADWTALTSAPDLAALETLADAALERTEYRAVSKLDGLGRVVSARAPDQSTTHYRYGVGGQLEGIEVQHHGVGGRVPYLRSSRYDALGRREQVVLGNEVETSYSYDRDSQRLAGVTSRRANGTLLQDRAYTYDPFGNVVAILDGAQPRLFFDNAVVSADRRFEYDARHRLTRAEGRCHPGQQPGAGLPPGRSLPHANDASTLERYVERYRYDAVGNILETSHRRGVSVAWRRRHQYALNSNHLVATSSPGSPSSHPTYVDPTIGPTYLDTYAHDGHGNMTGVVGMRPLSWDADDRLVEVDLGGGGHAYYVYDESGLRLRKIVRRTTEVVERRYLDGWEFYRRGNQEQTETLHVMNGAERIAIVETATVRNGISMAPAPRARYPLTDHLGSSGVEVGPSVQAPLLTYEEYFPFGSTSYRATASGLTAGPKRFRYSGEERDEETGFYAFQARYYLSWLGRWLSRDPVEDASKSAYVAMGNNPVTRRDADGREDHVANATADPAAEAKPLSPEAQYKVCTEAGAPESFCARMAFGAAGSIGQVQRAPTGSGRRLDVAMDDVVTGNAKLVGYSAIMAAAGQVGAAYGGGSLILEGMISGALSAPGMRALHDATRGEVSSAETYAKDTAGGALMGVLGAVVAKVLGAAFGFVAGKLRGGARLGGAARAPAFDFRPNPGGVRRTPKEALELAKSYGVEIGDDLAIGFIRWSRKDARAEYFTRTRDFAPDDWVTWEDFLHQRTGRVPVRFDESLLTSDEAIVAHIAHEMHEINALRELFNKEGAIQVRRLNALIADRLDGGWANNLHEQAWDVANLLVKKMRGG